MLKKNALAVVIILVLVGAMTGCLKNEDKAADDLALTEVADTELSYRNEPLMDPSITPADVFDSADAGDSKLLVRSFENAPPLIPHSTDDWLPITLAENQCLDCHLPENAEDEGATPTPASHLYDIRRGKQLSTLNPANYSCTQCHADQADVDILIENTFEPYFRTSEGEKQSNLLDILNDGIE